GAPFSVRVVKGAYWDEERIVAAQNSWPVPVFEWKEETDASFEKCTDALFAAWPHLRPAFGSHHPRSVAQAMVKARFAGRQIPDIEFQMLYGMAEGLRNAVAAAGYRTRVYVPVGRVIPGMAYLVRRLLENTSNQAWFNAGVTVSSIAQAPSEERARRAEPPFRNAPPAAFFEPEERERVGASLARARRGFGTTYSLLIPDRRVSDRPPSEVRCPAEPATIMGHVPGAHNENFHEGRGVTAVIAPWNFPLAIITGMTVGALAGGNTAILKPAAQSPIIAYRLVEILRDAGVPNDAIQYLPGPGG